MRAIPLHDGWTLSATGGPVPERLSGLRVPATVPGTVHTDLLDAGLIADPYVGTAESDLAWLHTTDWRYERSLTAPVPASDERVDLVLEGLDTVATITLGDTVVGRTCNQHRSFRFDVRDEATRAEGAAQSLTVDFASALLHAQDEAERLGARPAAYPHPLNMVRKMACSFGWDWGPDLQTAGIWRPVRLERWRVARLAAVRPLVTVAPGLEAATVTVHVDIERCGLETRPSPVDVVVRLTPPGGESSSERHVTIAADATTASLVIDVAEPALWWPVGHGDQPLHELEVELSTTEPLDRWRRRIGLRSVALDTSEDEIGSAFVLSVNGRPLFVRGANWIPDDHLLTRITRERLAHRIDQAVGANLNLLRVWGGGIYESEDFYELCDEAGLMVWQDFPLACAAYPEEEPHRSEFEAEAREHVTRLSAHPSLVLWNGGNENLWGFVDWGWQEELAGRTWGLHYYTELFPSVVAELDPTRPYAAGSPCSPGAALDVVHPNDRDHGTHHEWDVWNRLDYTAYRDGIPRFCSEFGFQGPPAWHTMTRAMADERGEVATREHPVWQLHQKAEGGDAKLDRGLARHLGVPDDFVDWHWAAQLNQARAISHAITHYRSWWPRTAGAIVWQLNDCWPVTSWAAVDGDGLRKPLWWALRAGFADRLLTVQQRPGPDAVAVEVLAAVNDTERAWTGAVEVRRETLAGTMLGRATLPLEVAPRSVALLDLPDVVRCPTDPADEVLVAQWLQSGAPAADPITAVHCWAEDIDLRLEPDAHDASAERVDDGVVVTVTATRGLVKDLTLLVDRIDPAAEVDAALVTLPAGATARLHVRTADRGPLDAWTTRPVLRTANDLAATRPAPPAAHGLAGRAVG